MRLLEPLVQLLLPIALPAWVFHLDPTEAWQGGTIRLYRSFRVLGSNYLCSRHTAITLALSATAEEAGGRPEKTNGRDTLPLQGSSSSAQRCCGTAEQLPTRCRDPPSRLPPQKQRAYVQSVGDLFTYRSRLLLLTNFILQE